MSTARAGRASFRPRRRFAQVRGHVQISNGY